MFDFLKNKKNELGLRADAFKTNYFLIAETILNIKNYFSFKNEYLLIEDKLDEVRFFEDLNHRRRLDAEVLSLVAANVPAGKMLDIGTYMGNSAARMAANSPDSTVYTVNIHPDELKQGGVFVTGAPTVDQIGSFYREKGLTNVKQIFANTKTWQIPDEINNLSLVYIDGSHDTEFVYNDTKLIIDRVIKGGFILWHDCSPIYRSNYEWIDAAMKGMEMLIQEGVITPYILNLKHSWVGVWKKN